MVLIGRPDWALDAFDGESGSTHPGRTETHAWRSRRLA